MSKIIKSREGKTVVRNGPSFLSLLTLLFIGLKLGGVIDWGWGAVLAPIFAPFALFGVLLAGAWILTTFALPWRTIGDWLFNLCMLIVSGALATLCLYYLITLIGGLF